MIRLPAARRVRFADLDDPIPITNPSSAPLTFGTVPRSIGACRTSRDLGHGHQEAWTTLDGVNIQSKTGFTPGIAQ